MRAALTLTWWPLNSQYSTGPGSFCFQCLLQLPKIEIKSLVWQKCYGTQKSMIRKKRKELNGRKMMIRQTRGIHDRIICVNACVFIYTKNSLKFQLWIKRLLRMKTYHREQQIEVWKKRKLWRFPAFFLFLVWDENWTIIWSIPFPLGTVFGRKTSLII